MYTNLKYPLLMPCIQEAKCFKFTVQILPPPPGAPRGGLYAYTGDAALYRQPLRYWQQLEDLDRSRTLGAEAKLGAGDAALYKQPFRYQEQLEDLIKLRATRIEATASQPPWQPILHGIQ